jgi:predicted methyltransferase
MDFEGKEVSDELNETLNRVVGDMPDDVSEIKGFLSKEEKSVGYRRCTWWGGCYYCQDSRGRWRLIYCVAAAGQEVSDELNETLNRIAGDMPSETEETTNFLSESERAASYRRCTWWGGCYYCQDSRGRWRLIYCVA